MSARHPPRAKAPLVLLPEPALLPAYLLSATETLESLARLGPDSGAAGVEPAEAFTALLLVAAPLVYFILRAPSDEEPRPLDPDSYTAQLRKFSTSVGKSAEQERLSTFGWLHADLRTPLPSLEELRDACHLIGERDGHRMWLCASQSATSHKVCGTSNDFSTYYGEEVFVCRGDTS